MTDNVVTLSSRRKKTPPSNDAPVSAGYELPQELHERLDRIRAQVERINRLMVELRGGANAPHDDASAADTTAEQL